MAGLIIIDRSEYESDLDYEIAVEKYIHPTKTEEDEIAGKRPEWPMITRDDMPA